MRRIVSVALACAAGLNMAVCFGTVAGAYERGIRHADIKKRVSIVVLGDSTAFSLAWSLNSASLRSKYDYSLQDDGSIGCGLVSGPAVEFEGKSYPPPPSCDGSTPPANAPMSQQPWPVQWHADLARYHPNVVMLLAGRWEVADRVYNGAWTNILNPTFAAYVKQQLELASNIVTGSGANLVLMTAPCTNEPLQPNGQPWAESQPNRMTAYNQLVEQVAAEHPTTDSVLHFNLLICPGDKYSAKYKGVQIGESDGIHFTDQAGAALAPAIMPTIVAAGRAQIARVQAVSSVHGHSSPHKVAFSR